MISVVVPVFNEESNLRTLFHEVSSALGDEEYEIIFANDGSTDDSQEVIEALFLETKRVVGVTLSRNFGQQSAIYAGLELAEGDACIVMDADLQDSPQMLPQFLNHWENGYEVVYAIKQKHHESRFKLLLRDAFYTVLTAASDIAIPAGAGSFCLMDRKVVSQILALSERNLFFPGIRSWVGFKQIGVVVQQRQRSSGRPAVSLRAHFKLAFDGIFSFSYLPLRLILTVGAVLLALSSGVSTYFIYQHYFTDRAVPGFTTIAILVTMLGSLNLMAISVVGEYILRIYHETKARPHFVIGSVLDRREAGQP